MPPNVILFLSYSSVYLVTLFVYRIFFYFFYKYRSELVDSSLVTQAFLIGFRFDFSVIAFLLIPFIFLSTINYLNRYKLYRFIWSYPPVILYIWMLFHLVGDIKYYENGNKHIGYEGIVLLGKDIFIVFQSFIKEAPIGFFSLFVILVVGVSLSYYIFHKFNNILIQQKTIKKQFIEGISLLAICIVFIRGGLQTSPLRPSHSIISNNEFINNLGLNGVFTSIYDLKSEPIPKHKLMKIEEAAIIVQKEISYPEAQFVSPTHPILRKTIQTRVGTPPNVVIVLLESWTGKFIKPISDGLIDGIEIAPNFNKLAREGVFFTKFFATGGRTTNGLLATLTGIPDRPGLSAIHSHYSMAKFAGLGTILKSIGYETLFLTGSDLSFENMKPHIQRWGFDTIIDESVIKQDSKYKPGVWGFDDGDTLDLLNQKLSEKGQTNPFLAVILTISTHYPYKVPDEKFAVFNSQTRDHDFLNVYHYSDWAVGNFIEKAKKEKYFENTVFIFLADHTHHRFLNYYEDRNIPLLFYSPKYFEPMTKNFIANQLDMIPTILGIVGKEVYFSAMGKDLFSKEIRPSAYFAYGNLYGWIENEDFYFQTLDSNDKGSNFSSIPPFGDTGKCKIASILCEEFNQKSRAFLNISIQSMVKNKIVP